MAITLFSIDSFAQDAWQVGVDYVIDDQVTYDDETYAVLQAHTSYEHWNPVAAPSLWQKQIDPLAVPDWQVWVWYELGSQVVFEGATYEALQAHTAQPDWTPLTAVPALWKKLVSASTWLLWEPQRYYEIGHIIFFENNYYRALNSHQAALGWEPDVASSLWLKMTDNEEGDGFFFRICDHCFDADGLICDDEFSPQKTCDEFDYTYMANWENCCIDEGMCLTVAGFNGWNSPVEAIDSFWEYYSECIEDMHDDPEIYDAWIETGAPCAEGSQYRETIRVLVPEGWDSESEELFDWSCADDVFADGCPYADWDVPGNMIEIDVCAEPYNGLSSYYVHDGSNFFSIIREAGMHAAALKTPSNEVDISAPWGDLVATGDQINPYYLHEPDYHDSSIPMYYRAWNHFGAYYQDKIEVQIVPDLELFPAIESPLAMYPNEISVVSDARAHASWLQDYVQRRYEWRTAYPSTHEKKWRADSYKVGSCEEYAYEKYHRYSKFQEFSSQLGTDYLGVFQIAHGMHPTLDSFQWAKILNEDLLDRIPYDCDGTATESEMVTFNTSAVYSFLDVVTQFDNAKMMTFLTEKQYKNIFAGLRIVSEAACDKVYDYLSAVVIDDDDADLYDAIMEAKTAGPKEIHDMDWHCKMYEGLLSNIDKRGMHCDSSAPAIGDRSIPIEQLYIVDQLKEEFLRLLTERKEMVKLVPSFGSEIPSISLIDRDSIIAVKSFQSVANFPLANVMFQKWVNNVDPDVQLDQDHSISDQFIRQLLPVSPALTCPSTSFFEGGLTAVNQAHTPLSSEQLTILVNYLSSTWEIPATINDTGPNPDIFYVNEETFDTIIDNAAQFYEQEHTTIRQRIASLDRTITKILRKAEEIGCFEPGNRVCDWSPQMFAQSLVDTVGPRREEDFQKCLENTESMAFFEEEPGTRLVPILDTRPAEYTIVEKWFDQRYQGSLDQSQETICGWDTDDIFNFFVCGEGKPKHWTLDSDDDFAAENYPEPPYSLYCAMNIDPPEETSWRNYFTIDTCKMDEFFELRAAACELEFKRAKNEIDKLNKAGNSDDNSASELLGNNNFGMEFEYDFGYGLDGLEELLNGDIGSGADPENNEFLVTKIDVQLGASVSAGALLTGKVFGYPVPLLGINGGAYANIDASGNREHDAYVELKLFGFPVNPQSLDVESLSETGGENEPDDDKKSAPLADYRKNFEEGFKSYFQIGPVPMSVTAGVAGGAGLEIDREVVNGLEPIELPDWQGNNGTPEIDWSTSQQIGVSFVFRPYAYIDVFAQIAVDIVVARFGVGVDLTLVNFSLPLSIDFNVGTDLNIEYTTKKIINTEYSIMALTFGGLDLSLNTNLDANLRMLDGKVYLFADVIILGMFKKTLFDWSGLNKSWNLFHFALNPPSIDVTKIEPIELY